MAFQLILDRKQSAQKRVSFLVDILTGPFLMAARARLQRESTGLRPARSLTENDRPNRQSAVVLI